VVREQHYFTSRFNYQHTLYCWYSRSTCTCRKRPDYLCTRTRLVNGQRYAVYREGEPYYFTDSKGKKHSLGIELLQVASGVAVSSEKDITTLELTDSYNAEVRRGDRVMPEEQATLPTLFYPVDAKQVKDGGKIIRVMGSIGRAAKNSVVTLDRGTAQGIQVGQIFDITQQGETFAILKPKK
jgi:hypothetical protein